MTDRAALVTGGSSGMGKAMAQVLGQEGYALTICGRDR
ncbi:MAG: SDR family NAD(P)-dependent oxidoreductase, partial [Candidatus Dormibacteraeota bacterium]|nr:SDR family NAD(P)-dependent oxidoreductase [Candidatus Dormibacteraeota bacterium]